MRFLSRLFMDGYQRALTDPAQYTAAIDAKAVIEELSSGKSGIRDYESLGYMKGAAESELENHGKLTIAGVAEQAQSLGFALGQPHHQCLHEFGVTAKLGAEMLADYLIRRANKLAEGIKPGASEELARAFG